MSKKILLLLLTVTLIILSLSLVSCGEEEDIVTGTVNTDGDTAGGGGELLTIECKTKMKPGDKVGFDYKMADGSPIYSKYLTMEIVGENTVGGEFEYVEVDNLTYAYFKATKKGTVKVQAVYSPAGKSPIKSNIIEITVNINEIKSVADFMAINGSDADYELACDLDLSGTESWTPIDFSGTLNGGGHKITGLKISVVNNECVGLFGTVSGKVSDLVIEGAQITGRGNSSSVGILAGKCNGEIDGVTVSGEISLSHYENVGGVVGEISGGGITNCVNNATVSASNSVGGIVGLCTLGAEMGVTDCTNNGTVFGKNGVGGICGYTNENAKRGILKLKGNKNTATIEGASQVGGLFGEIKNVYDEVFFTIEGSENSGEIKASATGSNVGGLVGLSSQLVSIKTSKNSADVTGGSYVGGYVGCSPITSIDAGGAKNENTITGKGMIGGFAGKAGEILNATNNGQIISTGVLVEDGEIYSYVGGIAGFCIGAVNCENNADITVDNNGLCVGGIAGYLIMTTDKCVNTNINNGNILGYKCVGGIAGTLTNIYDDDIDAFEVSVCDNIGFVSGNSYVGGVFGMVYCFGKSERPDSLRKIKISVSTNQGEVEGDANGEGVGGIVGYGYGISEIDDCESMADITGGVYVGGIAGYAEGARILADGTENNCTITGTLSVGGVAGYAGIIEYATNNGVIIATGENEKGNCFAGGIAGYCEGIIGCVNNADISIPQAGGVGGIAGYVNVSQKGVIYENTNNANVSGTAYVGGIIGALISVEGSETYKVFSNRNLGNISGNDRVGGIVGYVEGFSGSGENSYFEITDCMNRGEVTGNSLVGGIVGAYQNLNTDKSIMNTNTTIDGELLGQ